MRKLAAALVSVLALFALAGCSDDDDSSEASSSGSASEAEAGDERTTTTSSTTPALDPDDIDAEASEYCGVWAELRSAPSPAGKPAEEIKAHYADLVPVAERLVEAAEDDIRPAAEHALELTREVAESGDPGAFSTDEATETGELLAQYALEHCASS